MVLGYCRSHPPSFRGEPVSGGFLSRIAKGDEESTAYVSVDTSRGCSPGGIAHMGFSPEREETMYFVSTGRKDVRGGAAEYLKSGPEKVTACFRTMGKVTPPVNYQVISTCDALPERCPDIRSVCRFGTAEQIRNMAAFVHFYRDDLFSPVIVP